MSQFQVSIKDIFVELGDVCGYFLKYFSNSSCLIRCANSAKYYNYKETILS